MQGLSQTWVVSEKGELGRADLVVTQGDRRVQVPGRWLSLRNSVEGEGVRVLDGRFRGQVLIHLNDRGLLNVINELPVEEYLRGVVPKEMGPAMYDRLEALKAQTVACPNLHLEEPRGVRRRGLRHLRHPTLPGIRRNGGRASPLRPGHRGNRR